MTKECNSNQLCIIDNYAQWDRQTDPQTDNATTRLNGPQGPFSENILHERNLHKKVFLYFVFFMLFDKPKLCCPCTVKCTETYWWQLF